MKCLATVLAVVVLGTAVSAVPVHLRQQNELAEADPTPAVLAAVRASTDEPPSQNRATDFAVNFVAKYDAALPLTAERAKAKRALLSSDPFVFFRATPALFHTDCAQAKVHKDRFALNPKSQSPKITIGGDIHMANFGTFRGPDGDAVFGINDYDQSGDGTPDSDLLRLATSAVLAARNLKLALPDQLAAVTKIGAEYFEELQELTKDGPKAAYITAEKAKGKVKDLIADATKQKRGAFLDKYSAKQKDGKRRFTRGSELIDVTDKSLLTTIQTKVLVSYKILDVIEKLNSGGSSFGLPRYWALVVNPKDSSKEPVIIEMKYLLPPSLVLKANTKAHGPSLIGAQKALNGYWNPITTSTDAMDSSKAHYLIRETEPEKDSLNLTKLSSNDLVEVVGQCAKVLARAHTWGGQKDKAAALRKWIGPQEQTLAMSRLRDFAMKYADQVAADHAAYKNA